MNKAIISIIFFVLGAGTGAFVTRTVMNKKFVADRLQEMDAYEKSQKPEIKKDGATAEIEKEKEDILDPKSEVPTPVEVTSFSSHKINTEKTDYTKAVEETKEKKETSGRYPWDDEEKPKKKSIFDKETRPKPYIITKKQYQEENLHYHKITLMAMNNGSGYELVDDDEEPYNEELVGPENLELFGISDIGDPDVLYVRNEVESSDFEILKIDR